jgi:SAM-dependent methyltransferase
MVVVAQAFHWLDPSACRREFVRILRPGGWCVLLWNTRRIDATAFLRDYEQLLLTHGTDYAAVRHDRIDPAAIERFFGGTVVRRTLDNAQTLDREGLRGRVLSSSYTPAEGDPGWEALLRDLERLFDEHARDGHVRIEYDTELFIGTLRQP